MQSLGGCTLARSSGGGRKDVLKVCQSVELACANFYHYLAESFKDDRPNLLVWLKAAMEEENHARVFSLLDKLRNDNVIEAVRVELAEAEAMLVEVRALVKKVKRRAKKRALPMEEALRIAIDLENTLAGFSMERVIEFADDSYQKMFLAITNCENGHLEALQDAYGLVLAAQESTET
jgi:rubrerythrin